MKNLSPQSIQIIKHLRAHGSITALEALNEYGIMRLGARIWDLNHAGHHINREIVSLDNGKHVAKYFINNVGT